MSEWFTPGASLGSLTLAAFLAATLIPLSSEVALFAVLRLHPDTYWMALGLATLGNTLGGMSSYLIGRLLATRKPLRAIETVRRWGPAALLLGWAPLIGDALCVAAGWLRLNWIAALGFQAVGRFARYWLVAQGAGV